MSYNYQAERPWLFTEEGATAVHKVWSGIQVLLATAGAFRFDKVDFKGVGSTWQMLAILDRLVEMGELEVCDRPSWSQYKVYSTPQRHNQ